MARIRRRPARTLTAAGRRLDATSPGDRRRVAETPQEWQRRAWEFYNLIGEVRFAGRFKGDALGKLRLFIGAQPDPSRPPVPIDGQNPDPDVTALRSELNITDETIAAADDALDRLKSAEGGGAGHSELLSRLGTNLFVPGECYLVGLGRDEDDTDDDEDERWLVASTDELTVRSTARGEYVLYDRPTQNPEQARILRVEGDDADAFVARLWRPHPRWADEPDSPMRAVLEECAELLLLSKAVRATATTRLWSGMLGIPEEMSFGTGDIDPTVAEEHDSNEDPFISDLLRHLSAGIQDPGSAAAVMPFIIRGAREDLGGVEQWTFDRPFDELAVKLREELIRRIANGVDLPPEVLLGLADVNHWSAWQIDEQTFKAHIEPDAILIANFLTTSYLRPLLADENVPEDQLDQLVVWFDPERLVTHPNRGESADRGHDRLVLSDSAWRQAHGYSEEDAPDDDELARRIEIARELRRRDTDSPSSGGSPEAVQPGPPASDDTAASNGHRRRRVGPLALLAAASSDPLDSLGFRLVDADRSARERLMVAADAAMSRLMERAGAKIRSKVRRAERSVVDTVADVENADVARALGRPLVERLGVDVDELVGGAFDDLGAKFDTWVGRLQQFAIDEVVAVYEHRSETAAVDDEALIAQARRDAEDDRSSAWVALLAALSALARRRLFSLVEPEPGEFDPSTLVPPGPVREALARAGGAAGTSSPGGAIFDGFARPISGVAAGETVLNLLRETARIAPAGYLWVYGDASSRMTPFEPHRSLSGVRFTSFDDDRLAAAGLAWPYVSRYFPGDHAWCQCDYVPVMGDLDEPVAASAAIETPTRTVEG